jgi:methanogenic corrinoid protein MtbC1
MIHWCAYCQQYQGETPPFESMEVSHGMCEKCAPIGLDWTPEQENRIKHLADLNRRFWKAGSTGRVDQLEELANEGIREGIRPIDLLFGLAGPSLVNVGRLWESNSLTVAEEHRFTRSCETFIELISARIRGTAPQSPASGGILLTSVYGNEHDLGVRFALLGLAGMGLKAETLLPAVPPKELVERVLAGGHTIVGISVALAIQLRILRATLEAFAAEPAFHGKIIVCGRAVNDGAFSAAELPNATLLPGVTFTEADRPFFT